jgi:ABC-type methionine transport system ATPase subunit
VDGFGKLIASGIANIPEVMHLTQVDVNLTATKQTVGEPWICRLSRDFNVQVIIKKANVDEDCGWMQITLEGEIEEIQRATAWLMTTGLHVEAQQRAVGA